MAESRIRPHKRSGGCRHIVSLVATTLVEYTASRYRKKLIHRCVGLMNVSSFDCAYYNPAEEYVDYFAVYSESVFCLSPKGDSFTRKATFDMLLSGCIPIVWDELYIRYLEWFPELMDIIMWRWRWTDDVVGILINMTLTPEGRTEIAKRQAKLAQFWHQFQYTYVRMDNTGPLEDFPYGDAIDVMMTNLKAHTKKAKMGRFSPASPWSVFAG